MNPTARIVTTIFGAVLLCTSFASCSYSVTVSMKDDAVGAKYAGLSLFPLIL